MPITMFYAGALAAVFLVLSVRVVQGRRKNKVNLGDGGNEAVLRLMRGHSNFAEYVPLVLVMMALLETHGTSATIMHALGGTLLLARFVHGYTFAFTSSFLPGRIAGTMLTWLALTAAGLLCLWDAVPML